MNFVGYQYRKERDNEQIGGEWQEVSGNINVTADAQ